MSQFLSRRLQSHGLVQSDIRRMTRECERVGGINLGQGICDMPTPPLVEEGAIAAIRARKSTYSYPEGIPELRQAIAAKLRRDNGLPADPMREIVVTIGATGAFTAAIQALLDPGDGILIFQPYYGYHYNGAIIAGLEPQVVPLEGPDFRVTANLIREHVRPNTRAVVLCTPANPSGKMWDEEEIRALDRVAEEKDLLVLTDEIYEYIRYDGRRHISPATVGNLRERTVTIQGLSKTFSITGWRLGYAVAPEPMARAMMLLADLQAVCAPTPLQYGAAAGLNGPRAYFDELAVTYQKKRDSFCAALTDAGLHPIVPQGAYYVLADISRLGFSSAADAAMALLEKAKVASVAGTSFFLGDAGNRYLRFCFAKEDDVLAEAEKRIREFRI